MLVKIAYSFLTQQNILLSDEEFIEYDKFIDNSLEKGDLIKHGDYDFTGHNLAFKINKIICSDMVTALDTTDIRIDYRVKGQGVYFLIHDKVAVMTFSLNAVTFFVMKI